MVKHDIAAMADPTSYRARSFSWQVHNRIAQLTLNRPERKNPLTFASYAEMRDLFAALRYCAEIRAVVLSGADGNFSSGGDVHDIIGPLTQMPMPQLLEFTRMTGELVKQMRACPQPIIAAVDGVCAGAGAILAMASDLRLGTERAKVAFLFTRVGLAGCDMGACAILPRLVGQGRAAELLFTGRSIGGGEASSWGFFNSLVEPTDLLASAMAWAEELARGPTFAHAMTKNMLNQEWHMSLDQAIEAEAQAQALCMQTDDFKRAYLAFVAKQRPEFTGN
jgi:enoyl-CoA hydratase/carnithine racemase